MDIGALIPITVVLIVCSMISWLIWLITRTRRLQVKAQAELHHRLLEKFGSAQEFIDFLQSEGGQQFLDGISVKPINLKEQILSSVQKGVILTILQLLAKQGISHIFEVYQGDHRNRIRERMETRVLPFFSRTLQFEP